MSDKHILGIDAAKAKLDIALLLPDGQFRSKVIPNTPEGFEQPAAWLERNGTAQAAPAWKHPAFSGNPLQYKPKQYKMTALCVCHASIDFRRKVLEIKKRDGLKL